MTGLPCAHDVSVTSNKMPFNYTYWYPSASISRIIESVTHATRNATYINHTSKEPGKTKAWYSNVFLLHVSRTVAYLVFAPRSELLVQPWVLSV